MGANSAHSLSPKAPSRKERAMVPHTRLPRWIKTSARFGPNYDRLRALMKHNGLHTVCQEASCPNIRECWDEGTATFMILGHHCTRGCNFCDVVKAMPLGYDEDEPGRVASAVAELQLKQVVITSVTRDDLPDGGATIFARTIELLRGQDREVKVEVLLPDFRGDREAMRIAIESNPDVWGHNVETVNRLYKRVRPAMKLDRSLDVLRFASQYKKRPIVKSGFMLGLGETLDEVIELMYQLYAAGTDIVTIGQYLRPSELHLPIEKFYTPEEFAGLARIGMDIGFGHVEAGPLVRSSYRAFNQSRNLLEKAC